jgi:hypothetical protein
MFYTFIEDTTAVRCKEVIAADERTFNPRKSSCSFAQIVNHVQLIVAFLGTEYSIFKMFVERRQPATAQHYTQRDMVAEDRTTALPFRHSYRLSHSFGKECTLLRCMSNA